MTYPSNSSVFQANSVQSHAIGAKGAKNCRTGKAQAGLRQLNVIDKSVQHYIRGLNHSFTSFTTFRGSPVEHQQIIYERSVFDEN